MKRQDVLLHIQQAFAQCQRPERFIRGTCCCEECLEHEAVMHTFTVDDLPLRELNSPGWDPICFASNEAFCYLLPGLVTMVLEHTDDYIEQFIFHVEQPERMDAYTVPQAQALGSVLEYLIIEKPDALESGFTVDNIFRTKEKLDRIVAGLSGNRSNAR